MRKSNILVLSSLLLSSAGCSLQTTTNWEGSGESVDAGGDGAVVWVPENPIRQHPLLPVNFPFDGGSVPECPSTIGAGYTCCDNSSVCLCHETDAGYDCVEAPKACRCAVGDACNMTGDNTTGYSVSCDAPDSGTVAPSLCCTTDDQNVLACDPSSPWQCALEPTHPTFYCTDTSLCNVGDTCQGLNGVGTVQNCE